MGVQVNGDIAFVLTDNNLREGGRPRNPLEVCMNVNKEKAEYLGDQPFLCLTDDGETFEAYISGTDFKNFRSRHVTDLGKWLKARCRAMAGDEVHAEWQDHPTYGRVLFLRYVRQYLPTETRERDDAVSRRLERETEERVCEELTAAGVPVQRQVRVSSGIIDILTPDTIYEVKTFLTRDDMLKGTGQLMVYQAESGHDGPLRLVLIGRQTRETFALVPVLAKVGVEVQTWAA